MGGDPDWQKLEVGVNARAAADGITKEEAFVRLLDDLNEGQGIWRIVAVQLYEGGPVKNEPPIPVEVDRSALLDPSYFLGFEPNPARFKPVRGWPPHRSYRFEVSGVLLPRDIGSAFQPKKKPRKVSATTARDETKAVAELTEYLRASPNRVLTRPAAAAWLAARGYKLGGEKARPFDRVFKRARIAAGLPELAEHRRPKKSPR